MKKIFSFVFLSFLMTILFFSLQALAETIEIPTNADTYVDAAQPSGNYGQSEELYASNIAIKEILQRALFRFDLNDIPENATINDAYLKAWAYSKDYQVNPTLPPAVVQSRAIAEQWDENVSWDNSPDYYSTVESEASVKEDGWYNWNIKYLVQEWRSGLINNYGIYLQLPISYDQVVISSRESSKKPVLVVDYTIDKQPPETIINSGPSGAIDNNQAIFTFSGSDNLTPANSLTFSYRFDNGSWSAFAGYTKLTVTNI
ncbi:hypothetical protein LCGC14_2885650, partial [marine sediment metagenome]